MSGAGGVGEVKLREVRVPVEIPLKPVSRREVRQLEAMLIIGTLFRPDVIKAMFEKEEFVTWVDSLAVAAAALAMEKAGYTVARIAEELGRTEATIRRHLRGETKAGKLVRETYEMLARGELKLAVPIVSPEAEEELKKLQEEVRKLEEEVRELRSENTGLRERVARLETAVRTASEELKKASEALERAKEALAV